jgi:hypothetical protein
MINLLATLILLAENMSSDTYKLQWTNLNMTSGSKSSDNYQVLDTIGQTAPGEYSSSGFYVKAGFPYIKTIIPFSFTISDLSMDFGTLSAGSFATVNNTLTISFGGSGGYSVTAVEDHPLKLQTGSATLPDTTCNSDTCSETVVGIWNNTVKYGFGYNMSGNDIPTAFVNNTYFKQFADLSLNETPAIVMSSNNVGNNKIATVTYKANISAAQAAGDYENSIIFVATPTF